MIMAIIIGIILCFLIITTWSYTECLHRDFYWANFDNPDGFFIDGWEYNWGNYYFQCTYPPVK